MVQQESADLRVTIGRGPVEGAPSGLIRRCDVSTGFQEQFDTSGGGMITGLRLWNTLGSTRVPSLSGGFTPCHHLRPSSG